MSEEKENDVRCSRGVVFNTAPDGRIVMLSNVQALAEYGEAEE